MAPLVDADGVPPVRDARTLLMVLASAPNEERSDMIASTCEFESAAALAVPTPTPTKSVRESVRPRRRATTFFVLDLLVICMITIKIFDLYFDFTRKLTIENITFSNRSSLVEIKGITHAAYRTK